MTPTATETQFLIVGAWGQLLVAVVMAAVLAWQHRLHARATVLMWSLSFLAMALYVLGAAWSFGLAQHGAPVDHPWRLAAMVVSLSAAHAQIAWLVLGTLWMGRGGAIPRRLQAITVGGGAALGVVLALSYAGDPASGEALMRDRLALLYLLVAVAYLLCGIHILLQRRGTGGRSRRALGTGFALFGAVKLALVAQIVWGAPGTGEAPATGLVVLVELLGYSAVGIGIAVWLLADERRRAVAAQAHVSTLLRFDPVTGLHNRAGLAERWPELRDERSAVIVLAIEGFERAAPRLGANADRLLQDVAQRLQEAHGAERVAQLERARFGVLAGDGTDAARGQVSALLQLVEGVLDTDAPADELLPVAGLAAVRAGEDLADPLARASAACDEARRLGGSRWVDAEAALPGASDPLVRLRALRDAFDRGEFELHFQPQHEVEAGRLYGFEALVRWRHPQAGLLLPGRFTGAIERTGLSRRLDATVVELACAQLRAWIDAGVGAPRIAINLGAESIADQDLPEMLGDALARHRLSATHFAIELTETAALADVARCARVVGRLRAFGFGVALDDFGTGFSSLAHLRDLPVDTIKIDQRFIRGAIVEPRDAALVRGLAGLCASLGLRVVAEGVETAEQAVFARSCGIGVQQGWLYAPALPAAEAAALVARGALQPAA
jgi:EAL domain-containing protein (putative c-di-GMP-specific phosphodiesterase class I)/GGDEF domain-containing protein